VLGVEHMFALEDGYWIARLLRLCGVIGGDRVHGQMAIGSHDCCGCVMSSVW
jgi:hypothetical protein